MPLNDTELKDLIDSTIRSNKRQLIDGQSLNFVLNQIRESLGAAGGTDTTIASDDLTQTGERTYNQSQYKLVFTNAKQLKLIATALPPIGEATLQVEGYSSGVIMKGISPTRGDVFKVESNGLVTIKDRLVIGPDGYDYGIDVYYPSNASQGCMRMFNGGSPIYNFRMSGGHPVMYLNMNNGAAGICLQPHTTSTMINDLEFSNESRGVVLKDRTTGDFYRLKVDSGVLGIEIVTI